VALPVPIIAAINGLAFGGGAELAVRCDMRVMDPGAVICFSEVRLGLMPDWGGGVALSRLLGRSLAADHILTARRVNADEALDMGLVNQVVPRRDLPAGAGSEPGSHLRERIWLSAMSGAGLDLLRESLAERFRDRQVSGELVLAPSQGRFRARLHAVGAVRAESADEAGWHLQLEMPVATAERLATEPGGHLLHPLLLVAPSAPTYNPDNQ